MHAMSKSRAREKRMVHIKSTQYAISYAHLYNYLFRNKGKKGYNDNAFQNVCYLHYPRIPNCFPYFTIDINFTTCNNPIIS